MGRTACAEPQCLYKGALYLFFASNTERLCGLTNTCIRKKKWNSKKIDVLFQILMSFCFPYPDTKAVLLLSLSGRRPVLSEPRLLI